MDWGSLISSGLAAYNDYESGADSGSWSSALGTFVNDFGGASNQQASQSATINVQNVPGFSNAQANQDMTHCIVNGWGTQDQCAQSAVQNQMPAGDITSATAGASPTSAFMNKDGSINWNALDKGVSFGDIANGISGNSVDVGKAPSWYINTAVFIVGAILLAISFWAIVKP